MDQLATLVRLEGLCQDISLQETRPEIADRRRWSDKEKIAPRIDCTDPFDAAQPRGHIGFLGCQKLGCPLREAFVPERSEGAGGRDRAYRTRVYDAGDQAEDPLAADGVPEAHAGKGVKKREGPEDESIGGMEGRLHRGIDLGEPGEGLVDDQRLARCVGDPSDLAKGVAPRTVPARG